MKGYLALKVSQVRKHPFIDGCLFVLTLVVEPLLCLHTYVQFSALC